MVRYIPLFSKTVNCHDIQWSHTYSGDGADGAVWMPSHDSFKLYNASTGDVLQNVSVHHASDINHVQLIDNDATAILSGRMTNDILKVGFPLLRWRDPNATGREVAAECDGARGRTRDSPLSTTHATGTNVPTGPTTPPSLPLARSTSRRAERSGTSAARTATSTSTTSRASSTPRARATSSARSVVEMACVSQQEGGGVGRACRARGGAMTRVCSRARCEERTDAPPLLHD